MKTLMAAALAAACAGTMAQAQDKYLGEVFLVAFDFCPRGSAPADGRLVQIDQNAALFSLLATNYGGDGRTTFALPDLRGASPIGAGQGPSLSAFTLGSKGGAEQVTLSVGQMPSHTHAVNARMYGIETPGTDLNPAGNFPALTANELIYGDIGGSMTRKAMAGGAVDANARMTGGGAPVPIRSPYVAMTWCVVTAGTYPSR